MTIELVDGRSGKPHINGDDLGDFKAGILGDEGYVFDRGNNLAATLNGTNSVTIDTGSGIMPISGRHFRVTSPENATITSGTQGQNRNDLIVLRPTTATNDTTVESVAVVVLRGTPTKGSAADPKTKDTDLVLYRIQLTGVSVADPIALFSVMVPYNKFRDSISQYSTSERATGEKWINNKPVYRKVVAIPAITGNKATTVSHGISFTRVIRLDVLMWTSSGVYLPLARVGYAGGADFNQSFSSYAQMEATAIRIFTGSNTSYAGGYAIVEYTK